MGGTVGRTVEIYVSFGGTNKECYRIVQVMKMGHIKNLAWVVRMDVQKPAEALLNPKRMVILAINREMGLFHHFATGGVPSKHGMGGARY